MTRSTVAQRVLPIALTALTTASMAGTWVTTAADAASARTAKSLTFKGPVEYVDHGPVQVSIVVKNRKITAVNIGYSPQDNRSASIQGQALPILRQETLRAQSARINEVSGATDTSGGYIGSLQSAIKSAQKAKALK